jgi:hypothetical protein
LRGDRPRTIDVRLLDAVVLVSVEVGDSPRLEASIVAGCGVMHRTDDEANCRTYVPQRYLTAVDGWMSAEFVRLTAR